MSDGGWGGLALQADRAVYVVIRRNRVWTLEVEIGTLVGDHSVYVLERERVSACR